MTKPEETEKSRKSLKTKAVVLNEAVHGGRRYSVLALTPDGLRFRGRPSRFLTTVHVLYEDRRVTYDSDPEAWLTNLNNHLRGQAAIASLPRDMDDEEFKALLKAFDFSGEGHPL